MSLNDYPKSELEPRKLTQEEREDPYLVIHDFFGFGHLPEIRKIHWEFLKVTVSGSYHTCSRRERANLIYLYERIEQLIEAVHIIHLRTKKRPSE